MAAHIGSIEHSFSESIGITMDIYRCEHCSYDIGMDATENRPAHIVDPTSIECPGCGEIINVTGEG